MPSSSGDALLATLGGALARAADQSSAESTSGWIKDEEAGAWTLLPPSVPWAVIHFVGGAGFGVAPQICYDHLLSSLCTRLGVAVVATPFDLGTNHWGLSRTVRASFDKGLDGLKERGAVGENVPVYRVGHSLGARLILLGSLSPDQATSSAAAMDAQRLAAGIEDDDAPTGAGPRPPQPGAADPAQANAGDDAADMALLAFNNFGLADSVALASEFLSRMQSGAGDADRVAQAVRDAFGMAQQIANVAGVGGDFELTPSPDELERAVAASEGRRPRTLLVRFADDTLDSSPALLNAMPAGAAPTSATLDGQHLTPVVFRLDAEAIDPALAALLGNGRGFSFGSPAGVEPLVEEISRWIWPSSMSAAPALKQAAAADDEQR